MVFATYLDSILKVYQFNINTNNYINTFKTTLYGSFNFVRLNDDGSRIIALVTNLCLNSNDYIYIY
jgi:hypothetical protein